MFKCDPGQVVLIGFRTKMGGGYSNGFALVYDDVTAMKQFEPKTRLVRVRRLLDRLPPDLVFTFY